MGSAHHPTCAACAAVGRRTTLVDVLRARSIEQPDRPAFTFLAGGGQGDQQLTFGQLDRRARGIAATLQRIGGGGERAVLLFPPGLDYVAAFFGCLYAGVVAVPAYPPRPNRSLDRLRAIVADASPALALTTSELRDNLARQRQQAPELAALRWLATDDTNLEVADEWEPPDLSADAVAFLQYTSGSTGSPRGVVLSHANLLANLAAIQRAFGNNDASRGVSWLPPYHDMGLIGGILQPCYLGVPMVLMAPMTFLQHPFAWLKAMSDYRATGTAAPDFAYDLCARKITPEQRDTLDLSAWEVAVAGAEPTRADTLERFARVFAPCGFRLEAFAPSYGLAEATLLVTASGAGHSPRLLTVSRGALEQHRVVERPQGCPDATTLVGCGATADDVRVRIVDPDRLTRCRSDEVGEIWVAGPGVARGYWDDPAETVETFRASTADTGEGPFLRTGDLGFLHNGELIVTGRLKDLIIVDGRNHYPQDIERTVERSHSLIRPGGSSAFSVEAGDRERLVVAAEVDRGYLRVLADTGVTAGDDAVKQAIRRAVAAEHDLRAHAIVLLRPGALPRTSSGKVRRRACRDGYLAGSLDTWSA